MKTKIVQAFLLLLLLVALPMTGLSQPRARNYSTRDGLASNVVNCGLQDREGYLWLGTSHGLTRFDGHRFTNFNVESNGERQIVGITSIVEDTLRNVLLMSDRGYSLLCFDLTKMQFVSSEGMTYPADADAAQREQAYNARARELGIDRGNMTKRRHDLHYARLDDGKELFTTIDNGFFIYDGKTLRHYSAADEKPLIESDYINGIIQDRTGGIWLLTTFAGIYHLELGDETILQHALADNIRAFAQIDDRQIAVSDMDGHVFCYNLDTRQGRLLFDKGIRAYAIETDGKGRVWIGTRGAGVWIIDDVNASKMRKIENLPARQVYDIACTPQGTVWIATLDGGLVEGHEQADGSFSFEQYLQHQGVHEIDLDPKGRLWIATENGIFRKDGNRADTVFHRGKVVCVCHDADGTVWAGSNGHGLLKITADDRISFIQADNGLANNCVESVLSDGKGHIIAGTDQGISIVKIADGTVKNVYSDNGLIADTYNENAILGLTNGRIFLGSLKGMVELNMACLEAQPMQKPVPQPLITCLEINNAPRYDGLTSSVGLSHNQNNLCFQFSSMAYDELSSVIYSYWLEGIDREWRPSTKEPQALYTNLSPGCYRFHVRCRMAGNGWSPETLCEVHIAQPWWWTWWARAVYVVLIMLLGWYEWHQYQQRLSLRRQLDQRLTMLYSVPAAQEHVQDAPEKMSEKKEQETGTETGTPKEDIPARQKDREFLDRLDQLIQDNLLQEIDVNFLASELCMSYSTLHRRMKAVAGMTVNEYVRKHRLTKAMQMLREGYNATEVSMQCGFNSPSYFTRCFKSEYGILPSEV